MALEFQPRPDGFRVVDNSTGVERMLASLETNGQSGYERQGPMSADEFAARSEEVGVEAALAERDARTRGGLLLMQWEPLPRAECKIHSAIGPLRVGDIEEMLEKLPAE